MRQRRPSSASDPNRRAEGERRRLAAHAVDARSASAMPRRRRRRRMSGKRSLGRLEVHAGRRRHRRRATARRSAAGYQCAGSSPTLARIASSRRTVALAARQDRSAPRACPTGRAAPRRCASGWRIRKQRLCAGSVRISSSSCAVRPKPVAIILGLRASALGMKIIVAVCSTSAAEMRLSSASRADWVAKPTMRVALAQRLQPVADARGEDLVVERLPALVDQDHRRLAVEPLLDAVEQVHHRRRAQPRAVEQRGHVEAERCASVRSSRSSSLSNSQPCSPLSIHGSSAAGEVARLRAAAAAEQLAEIAQPAEAPDRWS